jgi:hypothetical protein
MVRCRPISASRRCAMSWSWAMAPNGSGTWPPSSSGRTPRLRTSIAPASSSGWWPRHVIPRSGGRRVGQTTDRRPAEARECLHVDRVTGRARFTADVDLPGVLWAKIVHSTVSHGRTDQSARGTP